MKNKINVLIKFLVFTFLFFLMSRASLKEIVFPFSFGMLFALAWANQKVWIITPAFLIGCISNAFSFEGVISAFCCAGMLVFPYYIHLAIKKPMTKWELFVIAILSQAAFLIFSVLSNMSALVITTHFVVGLIAMFLEVQLFESLSIRGLSSKLTVTEMVSAGMILMVLASGLENCDICGFSLLKLFASFIILAAGHISSSSYTMLFASLMGIGGMLNSNNPLYVAPFILYGIAVVVFKRLNKIFSAAAIILAELISTYYFHLTYGQGYLSVVAVSASALLFLCLPQTLYDQAGFLLNTNYDRMAVKNLLNRNREILQRRLSRLSEVFYEMNIVFKKLIKKAASEDEVKEMLYEELKNSICKNCADHKHCHRTFNEDTKKIFLELISIAFERGRITLLDIPNYLSSRCVNANVLINEINTLTKQYKSYRNLVGSVDTSKLLVSDQLEGVSGLMKSLSCDVDSVISVDNRLEEKLIDELSSNNIICVDALIYQKDVWTAMATLVVREEDVDKLQLQQIVSKVCKSKMCVYDVTQSERAGLKVVNLKTAPAFDCIFGLSWSPKGGNSVSGDCHSIERLDGDRFIFAVCDGMGNGTKAGERSEMTISLIENFYKAGFDSEIILSSVNRLLNLEGDETFSTIDACVVDLKNGVADFVKMGASSSYVRSEEGCRIVECESLPVGILDHAKTKTQKIVLKNKDFIVICSDGINDSFGSDEEFKDFLLSIKSSNPQEQSDQILQKALSMNNGYAVDDMTVIVVKIFN